MFTLLTLLYFNCRFNLTVKTKATNYMYPLKDILYVFEALHVHSAGLHIAFTKVISESVV